MGQCGSCSLDAAGGGVGAEASHEGEGTCGVAVAGSEDVVTQLAALALPLGDAQLASLTFEDRDGAAMQVVSQRLLELERREVLKGAFPECASASHVVAIVARSPESGEMREFIVCVKETFSGASPEVQMVMASCQISYEDITPSECIEYSFAEAPDVFALAQLSREALETYRGMKFASWKNMLTNPSCEAAFRRMLQIGVVTQLFDPNVFPTPEGSKALYEVTDETSGKLVSLPHPVAKLRIWSAESGCYEAIDPHLTGAPPEAEKAKWWDDLMQEFKLQRGEEYISTLLKGGR